MTRVMSSSGHARRQTAFSLFIGLLPECVRQPADKCAAAENRASASAGRGGVTSGGSQLVSQVCNFIGFDVALDFALTGPQL